MERNAPRDGRHLSCKAGRGAGEGNRTLVSSLEGFCSAIELHPRVDVGIPQPVRLQVRLFSGLFRKGSVQACKRVLLVSTGGRHNASDRADGASSTSASMDYFRLAFVEVLEDEIADLLRFPAAGFALVQTRRSPSNV